jgi:hypothetical protein
MPNYSVQASMGAAMMLTFVIDPPMFVGLTYQLTCQNDLAMNNLRDGGTIRSVAPTARAPWYAAAVFESSLKVSRPCAMSAIMLQDLPRPIESASIPPLKCTGLSNCVSRVILLR